MRWKSLKSNKKYSKATLKRSLNSNLGCLIRRSIWQCSKSHVKRWLRSIPFVDQMKASETWTVQCPIGLSTNLQHPSPLYEPSRTSHRHSRESNLCALAPSVNPWSSRMITMKNTGIISIKAIDTVKIKQLTTMTNIKLLWLITGIFSSKGSINRM